MNLKFSLALLCLFFASNIFPQSTENNSDKEAKIAQRKEKKAARIAKKNEPPHKGSIYFVPLPILANNPSFGFMYGLAANTSYFLGHPKETKISTATLGLTFTTKKQILITLKGNMFTGKNNFRFDTDVRYLNSSQGTYGLGSGPSTAKLASNGFQYNEHYAFSKPINSVQLLKFKWVRFYETAYRKVVKGFYLGLGYHLDLIFDVEDNLLDLDETPPVITPYYAYNEKYGFKQSRCALSGISLNAVYDTRDNINSPRKGMYALGTFRINPKAFGSNYTSTSLWLEYRAYLDLTKNHKNFLTFWTYTNIQTSGRLPYFLLPAITYDQYSSSGRGYTQGRIRGQALMYGEIEYRRKIVGWPKNPNFFGINVFANFTTASNKDADIRLYDYIDPAFGLGVRFEVSPKSRTTISLDYAIGKYRSSGIYLGINEFF